MVDTAKPPCHITGTAFITGAASGIGRSIARVFAQNGITGLALVDINPENLSTAKTEIKKSHPHIRALTFAADVSKEDQVSEVVAKAAEVFGRIDIAVHSAGIAGAAARTHKLATSDWQRVIDVNQTGVMLCHKWIVRQMLTQELKPGHEGRGQVVNIASIFGVMTPDPKLGLGAYVAAKHAIVGLTRFDAKTYAKDGIRINAIAPGRHPGLHGMIESGALDAELKATPLGRPAELEEVGHSALFLASRMGSFMCGAVIVVDGGAIA